MAIVGGLSHSALARLSKTISCLPSESQKDVQMSFDAVSTCVRVHVQTSRDALTVVCGSARDLKNEGTRK